MSAEHTRGDTPYVPLTLAEFLDRVDALSTTGSRFEKFRNFIDSSYQLLAMHAVPKESGKARLRRDYLQIAASYAGKEREVMDRMSDLCAEMMLTILLHPGDFLGEAYQAAQWPNVEDERMPMIVPYPFARDLAVRAVATRDDMCSRLESGRRLVIADEFCGCGSLVIAIANRIRELDLEPARLMFAVCRDPNRLCVRMSYLQLAVKHIPALCMYGTQDKEDFEQVLTREGRPFAKGGSPEGTSLDPLSLLKDIHDETDSATA